MTITLRDWAASYVRNCDTAHNGTRNKQAFSIAGHLRAAETKAGERLTEHDAIDVLRDWNQRSADPLQDEELRQAVKSAFEDNGTPRKPKIIETDGFAKPRIYDDDEDEQDDSTPLADTLAFAELLRQNPSLRPPVIDGLLRYGEVGNIIAASKVGKTWLTYDLALCILTAGLWLGVFRCTKGRVLLIDNELHPETIAHRIPKVAAARGINPSQYAEGLDVLALRGRNVSIHSLRPYMSRIKSGEYALILIDAKYRLIPQGASENGNADETAFYNALDEYAAMTGTAVLVVHHASKGSQADKAVTDVGAGAGSQSRAADSHIVLRPHEEDGAVVLDAAVRSFAPVAPVALQWEFPTWNRTLSLDPAALKGRKPASEERQGERDAEGIEAIQGVLAAGPQTERQIRLATGFGQDRTLRLLGIMRRAGEVDSREIKVKGNSANEYRLTQ